MKVKMPRRHARRVEDVLATPVRPLPGQLVLPGLEHLLADQVGEGDQAGGQNLAGDLCASDQEEPKEIHG